MRVYGSNGTAQASAPGRRAGGAFTVGEQETPRNAAAAGSLRAISTVDALIALQGVEDPRERKKRALAKGSSALDVLDAGAPQGRGRGPGRGDRRSRDEVLGEIGLRVAVELAKAGIR